MAFQKKTWKDRLVEFPGRRKLKDITTNTESVCDVTRAEGETFQAGDAYSEENMNNLESRIDDGFKDLTDNYAITEVKVVDALPSDASTHPTTFYWVKG